MIFPLEWERERDIIWPREGGRERGEGEKEDNHMCLSHAYVNNILTHPPYLRENKIRPAAGV